MESLAQLGVAERFLERALGWTSGRSYYRGKQVYTLSMPYSDDERFLPMYNLQQQYIEHYLCETAHQHPLVEVRWGNAVESVEWVDDTARIHVILSTEPTGLMRGTVSRLMAREVLFARAL